MKILVWGKRITGICICMVCTLQLVGVAFASIDIVSAETSKMLIEVYENEKFERVTFDLKNLNTRAKSSGFSADNYENPEVLDEFGFDMSMLDAEDLSTATSISMQKQSFTLDQGFMFDENGDIIEREMSETQATQSAKSSAKESVSSFDYMDIITLSLRLVETTPRGNPIYIVQGFASMNGCWIAGGKGDVLAIYNASTAIYHDGYERKGYVAKMPLKEGLNSENYEIGPTTANDRGVSYEFKYPGTTSGYMLSHVTGTNHLILTNDSSVQVSYHHNVNFFGGALGISFGPVSVNVTGWSEDFIAEPHSIFV